MGRAYTRITTTQRLDFVCPRCAHATTVTATGNTTVDGHNVDSHTIGYAARKHLDRLVALSRCPRCRQRAPGAVLKLMAQAVGLGALIGALMLFVFSLQSHGPLETFEYAI